MHPTTIAVVAEKPSVARDIAAVLGADQRGDGFLHGNGYVVTWAIGHLVALAAAARDPPRVEALAPRPPARCSRASGRWSSPRRRRRSSRSSARILTAPEVERVVCATDAGREGELIFRYIYEAAGCQKPVQRLWISSLTAGRHPRRASAGCATAATYDPLADAARGRSRADWLVGMNLSRAYALAFDEEQLSVGRVQTPTLAMVVERELAIRALRPRGLPGGRGHLLRPRSGPEPHSYRGHLVPRRGAERRGEADQAPAAGGRRGGEAARIVARAQPGRPAIESVRAETKRLPPPLLYDLTELQRHANRLFGFSAQKTLEVAQALYEQHKLISYPRTDSRHLSTDVAATLRRGRAGDRGPLRGELAPGTGERPLGRRFVDDAKVTDHHAIIPTTDLARRRRPRRRRARVYDLVCRRLLSAWHDDHV